jgi:hypothetical protein
MKTARECLIILSEKNINMEINRVINLLCENFDDDQLEYKLSNGVKLDNQMINLYFYRNIGFKCNNIWVERYGNLPLCNYIEKTLNQAYKSTDVIKKRVFDHTLYRIPTDNELKEFEKYPDLSSKQILNEFYYIMVGRGILDEDIKGQIIDGIQKLINLYPMDSRYKGALRLAHELQPKF